MTDEERQKLYDALRYWQLHRDTGETLGKTLISAREEIERLAALAQSDAEPQGAREKIARVLGRYGIAKSGIPTIANSILAALAQSKAEPTQDVRAWECKPKYVPIGGAGNGA